ncbi:MAG: PorP/SprF family type IX secretion system membrane protein [Crocinitomicaceae bacterium]|nr:PorP/SprF family type IX secretion system membrane protein [Crocinitomicaceae bacterium]
MKKYVLLSLTFLTLNLSFAQQDKQLTHWMFDQMSFNPAATGFNGYCGTLIYRNQWDRVERAPNTAVFNVQGNLPQQNLGVGLSFTNDAIGFQRNNTLMANVAYHLKTGYGVLSTGLGLGFVNAGFSPTWIPPQTPAEFDPNIPLANAGTAMDMNFGLYWHGDSHPYYIGLSTTHLLPPSLSSINYLVRRHYYVLGGYNIDLSNHIDAKATLKPSMLIKADGSTATVDVNVLGDFWLNTSSFLWGMVSYRLQDAISLGVGYAFSPKADPSKNMLKIGYSFDIMTNELNLYGRGTHELMVSFCHFPDPPVIGRHGNPFILEL